MASPAIERYRTVPLPGERLRYLESCAETGVRPYTLRTIAGTQVHLVHLLDLQAGDRVDIRRVEAAAAQWSLPGVRRSNTHARPDARLRFVGHAVRWLRFADMFDEEPFRPRHARTEVVAIFANCMRTERGWSEKTVLGCCTAINLFFDRLWMTVGSPWNRSASTMSTDRSHTGTPAASAG